MKVASATEICEDRGLLPVDTLRKAYEHGDPYHPRPIWENFHGQFQSINRGNAALGIQAYNGGLFADDPLLDRLQVAEPVGADKHMTRRRGIAAGAREGYNLVSDIRSTEPRR